MTKLFLPLLTLCLALTISVSSYPWNLKTRPEEWWPTRHEEFVRNTQNNAGNINVIFYGDSITENWQYYGHNDGGEVFDEYYAPLGTANYGLGGDQTQHLNWRIHNGEVEGLSPKLVVIAIGTNNIGASDASDNDIVAGVLSVVNSIKYKLPSTKILLLGILPRDNAERNARVRNINSRIQTIDNGNSIRYFDMFEVFCKGEDQFERELYSDYDILHLSKSGYRAWAEAVAPVFDEMMES